MELGYLYVHFISFNLFGIALQKYEEDCNEIEYILSQLKGCMKNGGQIIDQLLLMSTIAMIRQYDSKAADEIEEFWGLPEEDPVVDPKKIVKVSVFDDEKTSYGP